MDEIYLYPNPTKGNFEIELPMAYGKANIEIINTFGQTIMQKITNGDQKTSIFLDAPVGIYFMKIRNSADKLNVLKLLKE